MAEYARWYKPVMILSGLALLVTFTALISGGENGRIIGNSAGLISVILFGIWFWHMKSVQAKSLQDGTGSPIKQDAEDKQERKEQVDSTRSNFYQLLGVSKNASQHEIKKKFDVLALKYHPDQDNSSIAEQQFIAYRQAYEILSDPEKRKEYDRQINHELEKN